MTEFNDFKQLAQAQLAEMPRSYRSLSLAQFTALETVIRTRGVARDLPVKTTRTLATFANRPIRMFDGQVYTIRAHQHGGWYAA
jgi:hypothetical protein